MNKEHVGIPWREFLALAVFLPFFLVSQAMADEPFSWSYVDNGDGTVTLFDEVDFYNTPDFVEFPAAIGGKPVVAVVNGCGLRQMWKPTTIAIPASVKTIGEFAFLGYENLATVIFRGDESRISIAPTAFLWTDYNRNNRPFRILTDPSDRKTVVGHQGRCRSLAVSDWPSGITKIRSDAFRFDDDIESIAFPPGIKSIGDGAFRACGHLKDVVLNSGLEEIGNQCFYYCAIQELVVPDGVKRIGDWAFVGCPDLATLSLPDSVTNVGERAFAECDNLQTLYVPAAWEGTAALAAAEVPEGCRLVYVATVRFDSNGGSVTPASRTVLPGQAVGTLPVPSRSGYTFLGWHTAKTGGSKVAATTIVTASRIFYAHWAKAKYQVAFDANGGSGTMAKQTMAYGKAAKLRKNAFKRSGYVFRGWAKTKKGAVVYKNAATVKNLRTDGKTMTLYAKWAKKTYTVAFKANGGKGKMAKQKLTYGKAAKLRKNAFKRAGYTFVGWAKTKKGAVVYKNRAAVKNLRTDGKTTTLYAKWKANEKGAKKGLPGRRAEVTTSDGTDGSAVADGDESTGWTPEGTEGGAWVVLSFAKARDVAAVEVVGENLPEEGMRVLLSEDAEAWREEVPGRARYVWVAFPEGSEGMDMREVGIVETK